LGLKNKNLLKNDYFQTVVVVLLTVGVVFGFWFGSQIAFNTEIPPALAVVSGSMSIPFADGSRDGWLHPFDRTLQVGDIIVIQGVDPKDLKTDYPNSDVIVFHRPDNPDELIVHRIVASTTIDGKLYFYTKGDGNPSHYWPEVPKPYEYDPWYSSNASIPQGAVSQDLVVGKFVMRVPWIGHLAMFMHDVVGVNNKYVAIPIIGVFIVLLLLVEFVVPALKRKAVTVEQKKIGKLV
jgi:signal peptidase I